MYAFTSRYYELTTAGNGNTNFRIFREYVLQLIIQKQEEEEAFIITAFNFQFSS